MMEQGLYRAGHKKNLKAKYIGTPVEQLPTPALLIDRAKVMQNIDQMQETVEAWHCLFRAHIKTHKTAEGVACQLSRSKDGAIIVSTLAEAWGVVDETDLVARGKVKSILYGLPIGIDKIGDIIRLRDRLKASGASILLLVDHVTQVEALQAALEKAGSDPISVYIKVDAGYRRAGLTVDSPALLELVRKINSSSHVAIWGVYCHAGNSYSSKAASEAEAYLGGEVHCVNEAARIVMDAIRSSTNSTRHRNPLVLSVGSTPTAHAARKAPSNDYLRQVRQALRGDLELHAGNYPFLDLQQVATGVVPDDASSRPLQRCALTVLASVVSVYPGRRSNGVVKTSSRHKAASGDEALCDAGGLALSKDTGQYPGFGYVIAPSQYAGWTLDRISQEHGVLAIPERGGETTPLDYALPHADTDMLQVGTKVQMIPQHACMVAAAHPHFFIIDSSLGEKVLTIQDVWLPWKGW